MTFTLYYRGRLRSNAGPEAKQDLRRQFHPQLRQLWEQKPLVDFKRFLLPAQGTDTLCVLRQNGAWTFAPLVCDQLHLTAEISVLMLRPEAPGSIVHSGDIDNRIKTLLDALKAPTEATALPRNCDQTDDERPLFCLLEDDRLVTKLTVETERWLDPMAPSDEVVLWVKVVTTQRKVTISTIGLA